MDDLQKKRESYYRVTEVLCPFNGYGQAPAALMKQYQRRGTIVHKACNRFTEIGHDWYLDLEIDGVPATEEEITLSKPYVDSFSKWFDPARMVVLEREKRMYNDDLNLTGELDQIILIDDIPCIMDIKTSKSINKTWAYQLSAYRFLLDSRFSHRRIVVQVMGDGSNPNIIEYTDNGDLSVFLMALELYKIFCPRKKVIYEEGE